MRAGPGGDGDGEADGESGRDGGPEAKPGGEVAAEPESGGDSGVEAAEGPRAGPETEPGGEVRFESGAEARAGAELGVGPVGESGGEVAAERGTEPSAPWLTPGVAGVGAASFFSDSGHEITTAILPTFLTATLHAGPGALGLIEGVSDALTGVAKLVGGPLADEPARRARLASGGYLVTAVATGAVGAAGAVWQVGVLRAFAWAARGIRSPSRDALLASLTDRRAYGRAFGLERAGDNLGAVVGPLLASLMVTIIGVRHTLYLAAVPGLFAAAAITLAARQARGVVVDARRRRSLRINLDALRDAGVGRALVPIAAFELGNVATTLLILRATDLLHGGGRDLTAATALAILLYVGHNVAASVVALGGGHWIDRAGARVVFGAGAAVYVAGYLLFAFVGDSWPLLLVAMVLAGAGIGLAETAESALFAGLLPDHLRGSGFGLLGLTQSLGAFASTAVVGLVWAAVSPTLGFGYAAGWMLLAVAAVAAVRPGRDAGSGS